MSSFHDLQEHYGEDPFTSIDENFSFVQDAQLRRFLVLKQVETSPCLKHQFSSALKMELELIGAQIDATILKRLLPFVQSTEVLLASGGDDRLTLNPANGFTTKYLSSTLPRATMVRRGSCTCTTTSLADYVKADDMRRNVIKLLLLEKPGGESAVDNIMKDIRCKMENVFGFEHSSDSSSSNDSSEGDQRSILFPSGSDAEFLPVMAALVMSHNLCNKFRSSSTTSSSAGGLAFEECSSNNSNSNNNDIKVYNFVTAAGEVGSGTTNAAKASYFSGESPRGPDSTGCQPKNNSVFRGIQQTWISLVEFKARNNSNGSIDFSEEEIAAAAKAKLLENECCVVILHLVCGSKTGLEYPSLKGMVANDLTNAPILKLSKDFSDRVVLVVDMCQLRNDLGEVKGFVTEHNAFCLVTASKFYCGPPFSGAVVFPKRYADLIESYLSNCKSFEVNDCILSPDLTSFLSSYEIPITMPHFREYVSSYAYNNYSDLTPSASSPSNLSSCEDWINSGLILRWSLGLHNMEQCKRIPRRCSIDFMRIWVDKLSDMIASSQSPYLVLLPSEASDNLNVNSIISIAIMKTHSTEIYRAATKTTQVVRRCMTVNEAKIFHQKMTEGSGPLVSLGQPVKLCEDFSLNTHDDSSNSDVYGPLCTVVRIAFGADMLIQLFDGCHFSIDETLAASDFIKVYKNLDRILEDDRRIISKMHDVAKSLDELSFKTCANKESYYSISDLDKIISALGGGGGGGTSSSSSLSSTTSEAFTTVSRIADALKKRQAQGPIDNVGIYYDFNAIYNNINYLNDSFRQCSNNFLHCFAVKSCPVSVILRFVVQLGMGLETASIMEVKQSLRVGCHPSKIVFDSPCKTIGEIEFALRSGVSINANSIEEFEKIKSVFDQLRLSNVLIRSVVGLRINPLVGSGAIKALSTATINSKFGIPLPPLSASAANSSSSEEYKRFATVQRQKILKLFVENDFLTCVMCHVGSQGMPLELMVDGAVRIAEFADEVDRACGSRRIDVVDIGGGLSVDYFSDVRPKFDEYAKMLHSSCKTLFDSERKVVTEFGKSVIAKTGVIVAKVEDVLHPFQSDNSVQHAIAITHVGADLMLRTAYCPDKFSHRLCILDSNFSSSSSSSTSQPSNVTVTVAGPLCFSGDIIGDNLQLPSPSVGDWLVVSDAGANTLSLFSRHCSRQSPPVFGVSTTTVISGSGPIKSMHIVDNFQEIRKKESEDGIYQFWG